MSLRNKYQELRRKTRESGLDWNIVYYGVNKDKDLAALIWQSLLDAQKRDKLRNREERIKTGSKLIVVREEFLVKEFNEGKSYLGIYPFQ